MVHLLALISILLNIILKFCDRVTASFHLRLSFALRIENQQILLTLKADFHLVWLYLPLYIAVISNEDKIV